MSAFTESDTRVLLANILTLLIGEEHVGRQATLGCIGVWLSQLQIEDAQVDRDNIPFFFFPPSFLAAGAAARFLVVESLGMMMDVDQGLYD